MQGHTYQDFAKMDKQKRHDMVNQQKQSQPSSFSQPVQFPEVGFMPLETTQEGKAIKLTTYRFAAEKTKGVVIFFHTMAYHIGIYANIAKALASNGFTFVGYDQRGHGKSQGQRAYMDDYKLLLKDARTFISNVFKMYPNTPVFLMGHGFGSLLSIILYKQFKQFKFAGIIAATPALKKPENNKLIGAISGVALKLLPNKTGLFAPMFQNICRNPNVTSYLRNDPLVYHDKVMVGTLMQLMELMEKNEEQTWSKLETCPIIIIQGQFDKGVDSINSINFYEAIKTKDKELWWYPGMWNNFFFEPQAEQINKRLISWLNQRT